MNDRVKAILATALKLSPEERQELARALVEAPEAEPSAMEPGLDDGSEASGGAAEPPLQPANDVLARYLET